MWHPDRVIEVVRSRLDARQSHRWTVALAARPILADYAPSPARGPQLVAMASAWITLAMLVVVLGESAFPLRGATVGAVALAGCTLAVRTARWMWRQRRAAWPSGRFVFRWGYVEAEHDRLRVVEAAELQPVPTEHGGEIVVRHTDGTALHTFAIAPQQELDLDALARLGQSAPPLELGGYREAVRPRATGAGSFRLLSPRARDAAWVALAAVLGLVATPYVQAGLAGRHARPLRAVEDVSRGPEAAPWDAAPRARRAVRDERRR